VRKIPEISGTQIIELNEINMIEKTLNRWVEGSIPSRLIEQ